MRVLIAVETETELSERLALKDREESGSWVGDKIEGSVLCLFSVS